MKIRTFQLYGSGGLAEEKRFDVLYIYIMLGIWKTIFKVQVWLRSQVAENTTFLFPFEEMKKKNKAHINFNETRKISI